MLVQLRHVDTHQGGLWEFPGGKVDPGEGSVDALAREWREELGVEVLDAKPLTRVTHDYGDRIIDLEVFEMRSVRGSPRSLEGQATQWVEAAALGALPMPAADLPVVQALVKAKTAGSPGSG